MSYSPHFHYDKSNRKKVKVEISILNLDIRKTREAEEGETNERPGSAEIIEFPILKLNGQTMEIESIFHTYVQPVYNPQLTPFCTQLTGIIQSMVEGQPTLQQALQMVAEWMDKENLLNPDVSSVFVTCGDWDLKTMLPGQCQHLGLQAPDYFKQWINLKKRSQHNDKEIRGEINVGRINTHSNGSSKPDPA
ncbi:hypothetical protein EOD39_7042 [Acipenser ruthenus]|uniref:Exonuclease domain-containing protein n=1 Tax=Acipenser ruthenus TaxID=7906 RepID=A0A662YZ71_ACIRT|nr:hypothetical protein EOD39_7042 [Acipenser ruthenus]